MSAILWSTVAVVVILVTASVLSCSSTVDGAGPGAILNCMISGRVCDPTPSSIQSDSEQNAAVFVAIAVIRIVCMIQGWAVGLCSILLNVVLLKIVPQVVAGALGLSWVATMVIDGPGETCETLKPYSLIHVTTYSFPSTL